MGKIRCYTWVLLIAVSGVFTFCATAAVPADTAAELWQLYGVYPYGPMSRQIPGLNPNAGPIEVILAQGELESVCLAVDNRKSKDTFDFRVLSYFPDFPKDKLRVGRLVYLLSRNKPHPGHIDGSHEVADAIVPVSATEPVTVAAGESRHLWLTVDARGVPAGQYSGRVTVRPMTVRQDMPNHETKKIQINIRVLPFALPDKTPLNVFSWEYGSSTNNDEWLANFIEHRQNVFHLRMDIHSRKSHVKLNPDGTLAEKPDFSELTERLLRGKPYGKFFFETDFGNRDSDKKSGRWECTDGSTIPYLSDRWAIGYKQWLGEFKAYMESLGIGTDQWYIVTHDEAFFQDAKKGSLGCAKLTYQVDPTIQYFMNSWPGGPEQLKPWRSTNTTWCPDYGTYNQASWHWIKAEKTPTWMYFCHHQTRHLSPHAFYRGRGWLAWIFKLDGVAFFSPGAHMGSQWDDLDGKLGDPCLLLEGAYNQPVNTRRWEAYREGIEDYMYLHLLDNLLKTKEPDAALATKARKLMADACLEFELATDHAYLDGEQKRGWIVTGDNAKTTEAQRKQIAKLIIKLRGSGKN